MAKSTNKQGYIKVSREFLNSTIWRASDRFSIREVWIDLNLRANHSGQEKIDGMRHFILKRGQLMGSLRQFAEWWNMDKDTAKRRLELLEELGLIKCDSSTQCATVVTLCKYWAEQAKNGLGCDTDSDTNSDTNSDNHSDKGSDTYSDASSEHYKNVKECKRMLEE